MLSLLVTSAARRKLLVRFLTHPGERFYLTQLIRAAARRLTVLVRPVPRLMVWPPAPPGQNSVGIQGVRSRLDEL